MNEDVLKELKEQTKWIRFLAMSQLRKTIEDTIITKEQKRIYELTNGENSTHEISKQLLGESLKVSHMTVYNYWKKWSSLGLVVPSNHYQGRCEKIVSLKELELEN